MGSNRDTVVAPIAARVNSIDFFRGLTMFLLAGESTQIFSQFLKVDNSFIQSIAQEFHHHEWHGLISGI